MPETACQNRLLPLIIIHEDGYLLLLCDMQDLQTLAATYALPAGVAHDVSGKASDLSTAYTLSSHADLQDYLDLVPPPSSSCSIQQAQNSSKVDACATSKKLCCVAYSDLSSTLVRASAVQMCC